MIFQSRINRFVVCFLFNIFIYLSRESYNAVASWLSDARTLASPNIVIILCGNKKDLEDQRQVTFNEASRFAQENGKI
jgi:Ras-related protein Rab-4B